MQKIWLISMLLTALFPAAAQQPTVKPNRPNAASGPSGKQMFAEYCAACHGQSGKGNGPTAPALKVPPTDLTMLEIRNGGRFPEYRVVQAIKAGGSIPAHGSQEMPTWGTIFSWKPSGPPSDQRQAELRIGKLTEYIKTIQAK